MSDADKSLEIEIKTKADLAGALKVEENLKRQILNAKLLGKEHAAMEAQLGRVTSAIDKFGRHTDDGGKELKLFQGHMEEVRHAIRELSGEFPVAGLALRLATNVIGGALTLGITTFIFAKRAIDDWNKSLDESAKKLAEPLFIDAINARKAALEAGAIAAAKHADALRHLVDPQERYAKAIQAAVTALHAQNAAQGQIADAQLGFDSEKLKHQLELGLISQAQYFTNLEALERKHEADRLAREKKAHEDELNLGFKGLRQRENQQPELEQAAGRSRTAAAQAQGQADSDEAKLKTFKDEVVEKDKIVAQREASLKTAAGLAKAARVASAGLMDGQITEELKGYQDAVETAQKEKALAENHVQKLTARLPEEKTDAVLKSAAADRAAGRSEQNATQTEEERDALNDKAELFGIQEKGEAAASKIKGDTRSGRTIEELEKLSVGEGFDGEDVERAALLEQAKAAGKIISAQQQEFLGAFEQFAQSHGAFGQKQLNLMYKFAGTQTTMTTKVEALATLIEQLQRQVEHIKLR